MEAGEDGDKTCVEYGDRNFHIQEVNYGDMQTVRAWYWSDSNSVEAAEVLYRATGAQVAEACFTSEPYNSNISLRELAESQIVYPDEEGRTPEQVDGLMVLHLEDDSGILGWSKKFGFNEFYYQGMELNSHFPELVEAGTDFSPEEARGVYEEVREEFERAGLNLSS